MITDLPTTWVWSCNRPQRVYILRGVQRRCVWAVGRLGVAAAWPASRRRSTGRRDGLVLSGVAVWIDRRSALGGRTAPPDTHRHRPDTERTCLAVEPTKFTPAHQTRQNSPVCVVSGVAVRIGQLLLTRSDFRFSVGDSLELSRIQFTPPRQTRQNSPVCVVHGVSWTIAILTRSDFRFSVGDSLELSGIQFTPPKRTRPRQDSFVVSGVAVWISFNVHRLVGHVDRLLPGPQHGAQQQMRAVPRFQRTFVAEHRLAIWCDGDIISVFSYVLVFLFSIL